MVFGVCNTFVLRGWGEGCELRPG